MSAAARYAERLRAFPPPGQGRHAHLLSVANWGVLANISPEQIYADIEAACGFPPLPRREIEQAIRKALHDCEPSSLSRLRPRPVFRPTPRPAFDGEAARRRLIEGSPACDEVDVWEASPIRIDWPPEDDASVFIETLFGPEELVFVGRREDPGVLGKTIRQAASWTKFFRDGGKAGPLVCVNPLTGRPAPKKSGEGETLRGDGCVASLRHVLLEFDSLRRREQLALWGAARLPVRAVVDAAGRSLHVLVDVEALSGKPIRDLGEWDCLVRGELFGRLLGPLGVDRACANAARLGRLPGVRRADTGRMQKLLWLSPVARAIVKTITRRQNEYHG